MIGGPDRLAGTLLEFAATVVPAGERGPLFAPPVVPARPGCAGDRLVAVLGRDPRL